jgi:hypothetical protein
MTETPVSDLGLSLIVSEQVYDPPSIASKIVNLIRPMEQPQTLKTGGQLTLLDPKASHFSTRIDGLAHAEVYEGAGQATVVRSGTALYIHAGYTRTWDTLRTGLTYDPNQPYPDVMLSAPGGFIIWSNGLDNPLIIDVTRTAGRLVEQLGFHRAPAAPSVLYPSPGGNDTDTSKNTPLPPNYQGYAIPGKIGTLASFAGEDGSVLDGSWLYYVQWEDVFGNLSPLSNASAPAIMQQVSTGYVTTQSTDYKRMNHLDMLTRQFVVRGLDKGEEHVGAIRIYRTPDTLHSDSREPLLLARIEGRDTFTYPDNIPDSRLTLTGLQAEKIVPVQPFKVGCIHQGRLAIGNLQGEAGKVRWSQPGFYGTFNEFDFVVPDNASGSEVTGLQSWGSYLYAFTHSTVYRIDTNAQNAPRCIPVADVGCSAPQTIQSLPDGTLMWLGRGGFVIATQAGDGFLSYRLVSTAISKTTRRISIVGSGRACATVDRQTGLYLCAFDGRQSGSSSTNDTVISYDVQTGGFTFFEQSLYPTAMTNTGGRNATTLWAGLLSGATFRVYAWNRRGPQTTILPTSTYRSNFLRIDPSGLRKFNVREILVGFIETESVDIKGGETPPCYLKWYTGDRINSPSVTERLQLVGEDYPIAQRVKDATLGTDGKSIFLEGMVRWRRVSTYSLKNVSGFWFEINMPSGEPLHLVGIKFIVEPADKAAGRTAGPT